MVTNEETDILWEEMKKLAVEQQQCFYELLPECTIYEPQHHKYLKQNIGYALYGSPTTKDATANSSCYLKSEISDNTDNTDTDIADIVEYKEEAREVINTIYNKMCESDPFKPIYYGIIYNLIFRPKMKVMFKKKEAKESEKEDQERRPNVKEDLPLISLTPIFTVRKSILRKRNNAQNANKNVTTSNKVILYETWYIDTSGRVYKSWTDYIENNTLPKCTMILPKDGIYQPDPCYPITEDYSTVWLEIKDSPACTMKATICNGIDIASTIAGFGSLGLGVAAALTTLAPPLAVTGLVATGISGLWTIGRCSHQLIDRSTHEESINIRNKEAFGQWLGIAGTAFGLGAAGGTVALSRAAARSMTINTIATRMFNVIQSGNIVINGIGVVYQGYCIVDKYKRGETCKAEVLNFVVHAMFFAGSIVKVQFANDIIENTQGKVIADYKDSITKKRLRNKFNRVVRKAAENNTCKITENAEVIKYINHRQQLPSAVGQSGNKKMENKQVSISRNIVWSFEQGKLKIGDIVLLDPIAFVTHLIKSGTIIAINKSDSSDSQCASSYSQNVDDFVVEKIMKVLCDLLNKFYKSENCSRNLPTVPDFEPLIKRMSSMRIDEDCFKKLFTIAESLIRYSKSTENFLLNALGFIWQYCQVNLKEWGINSVLRMQSDNGSKILQKIIVVVFEAIDMILNNLRTAFLMSVKANLFN